MPTLVDIPVRLPTGIGETPICSNGCHAPGPQVGFTRLLGGGEADQFDLFDVVPHGKPLLFVTEAAAVVGCSSDQVLALIEAGKLHGVSISTGSGRREHLRVTRLSVRRHRLHEATPGLADYGITQISYDWKFNASPQHRQSHWCVSTRKQVLRGDELATLWRVCTKQVWALIPEMSRWSISDGDSLQRFRVATGVAQAFIDQRLIDRNFTL